MYFSISHDSQRLKWTVNITVSDLLPACQERLKYHESRIEFWTKERKQAEDKLRSDGIQLRHYSVTGGERMEAKLDDSLARRVSECENKVREHNSAIQYFNAYHAMLSLAPLDSVFKLGVDDVLYFNLANADKEQE